MTEIPGCAEHLPELYCRPRSGPRSFDALEDAFRRSKQRVTLESAVLDARYEMFVRKGQDGVWVRRLFSPSFVAWLAERLPETFAFELADGTLVVYVGAHIEDAPDLDRLAATTTGTIAERLRDEIAETTSEP